MTETVFYNSPVGTLQLVADHDVLTELSFCDNSVPNQPQAAPQSRVLQQCMQQLDDYFAGRRFHFQLSLQQAGTPFQQQVWQALQGIEPGKTVSYLQLSKNIGNAKAIRAVGTANGKNNIAIIVPCHRVIGSNGSLVGYSGELWRKQWLLQHEAKYLHGVQNLFG